MLPQHLNYPDFVPDQLLTSEHLNQLFNYLDEQGKITRTNLIGIGIVCGLEVKTNADGSSITITKGCGVTSEGYLISVPELSYSSTLPFNAVQDRIYEKFVNGKVPRFELLELKQSAVEDGTTALSASSLTNKVVMIYVEILEEGAKNCNPNSCDDKGVNVSISYRPLLIDKEDADSLGEGSLPIGIQSLPDLKMKRFDVQATALKDSAAIFTAYQKVLDAEFLKGAEEVLTQTFNAFSSVLVDIFNVNPFQGLASAFKFLHDGSINGTQLLNLQYYYDLFSDLILAYTELRERGAGFIGSCCPDSGLFPQHLLLDRALPESGSLNSAYRHYFIPSPILQEKAAAVKELRSLFRRLVLLVDNFSVPPVNSVFDAAGLKRVKEEKIRITPSKFGESALSDRAIPYYYKLSEENDNLLHHWSFKKSVAGLAHKNLSYQSSQYNRGDEEVLKPLLYDLEPYNFLRIEGHLGRPYVEVLRSIILQKRQNRLPFEVIALSTDVVALRTQIRSLSSRTVATELVSNNTGQDQPRCQFQDLESLYDALAAELTCSLCKEMKYYYDIPFNSQLPTPNSTIPQVPLLVKCDPNFRFTAKTLGHQFELFYATVKDQPYVNSSFFLNTVFSHTLAVAAVNNSATMALGLMYYIQKLSETLDADLSDFDIAIFNTRYNDLTKVAAQIRESLRNNNNSTGDTALNEDVHDHLDTLIFACKQAQFAAIHKDYLSRWVYVMMLQKFGYFLQMHPGMQHKAGVTVGGTFIVVYHEAKDQPVPAVVSAVTDSRTLQPKEIVSDAIRKVMIADAASTNDSAKDLLRNKDDEATRLTSKKDTGAEKIAAAAPVAEEVFTERVQKKSAATLAFEQDQLIRKAVTGNKVTGSRQLDYLESILQGAVKGNRSIESLIADIDDGVVIADFFLPYLCYSDCPPVHYIFPQEKEPEEPSKPVSIDMKVKEFCSGDRTVSEVIVSPEGGNVTGEGIRSSNGKFQFSAATVDLAGAKQKEVTLTYSLDGQSASIKLLVHQTPTAAFKFDRQSRINQFLFTDQSTFADTWEWEFGDGETSTEQSPTHAFQQEGVFQVKLVVVNGTCRSAAAVVPVEVKRDTKPNTCYPITRISGEFIGLQKAHPNQFPVFRKNFELYKEISAFFERLATVENQSIEAQLKFFIGEEMMPKLSLWLSALAEFFKREDMGILPFALHKILVLLAMYIQCIQEEDLGKGSIDLSRVFLLMKFQLENIGLGGEQVEELIATIKKELERTNPNNKPEYVKLLNEIINGSK
jgi:hypothetical protein